ncbi:1877_t:CDS:2, partial [Ambispora leptoticha]
MDQRPLPQGWIAKWDPRYQRHYFVEPSKGITTWEDPRGPLSSQHQQYSYHNQTTITSRSP